MSKHVPSYVETRSILCRNTFHPMSYDRVNPYRRPVWTPLKGKKEKNKKGGRKKPSVFIFPGQTREQRSVLFLAALGHRLRCKRTSIRSELRAVKGEELCHM